MQFKLPVIYLVFLWFVMGMFAALCWVTAIAAGKSYPCENFVNICYYILKELFKMFPVPLLLIKRKGICKIFNTLFSPLLTVMTVPHNVCMILHTSKGVRSISHAKSCLDVSSLSFPRQV